MAVITKKAKGKLKMMRRFMLVLAMVGGLLVMAGCNTVAGFGQDITNSARAVQRVL